MGWKTVKESSKKEAKICFILYTLTSCVFLLTGIMNLVDNGFNGLTSITDIALSVTFGSLACMFFKKYKSAT